MDDGIHGVALSREYMRLLLPTNVVVTIYNIYLNLLGPVIVVVVSLLLNHCRF